MTPSTESHAGRFRSAAIVTVGRELTAGLRTDTNTAVIARAVAVRGFTVTEAVSVADDVDALTAVLTRLLAVNDLVITTGGLGPTHDDLTREAAAGALGVSLFRDARLVERLTAISRRHTDSEAVDRVFAQADVLAGAEVIDFGTGTAAGQIMSAGTATLVLLPGPPAEMTPMLTEFLHRHRPVRAEPVELGITGLTESDAQVRASRALTVHEGVGFTILAHPGDVRVLLLDDGAGDDGVARAATAVAAAFGDACYSSDGLTLPESIVAAATRDGVTVACAESCTGGLVAAAITEVPGASSVFRGGAVTYADSAKSAVLGVEPDLVSRHGAVSEQVVIAMAEGVRTLFSADVAVAVTGIAGPDGGSASKPVGLVWFAVATDRGTTPASTVFPAGTRSSVRARATAFALDLLRRAILE